MAHGYRTLQHWNDWLADTSLGASLMTAEQEFLSAVLEKHYGKQALLIGVPNQFNLLNSTALPCHALLGPLIDRQQASHYIESTLHDLPIQTGSVDLLMLPHTLEWVEHPRHLLTEACRIVKPEGLIAICGFNPYSFWGVRKLFARKSASPWSGNFLNAQKIKSWLKLADFALEKQATTLFRPPLAEASYFNKLHFLESVGKKCFPVLGGIYIIVARAKVIPLTPIRLTWKQQFSNIRLPTTISGHIARSSK